MQGGCAGSWEIGMVGYETGVGFWKIGWGGVGWGGVGLGRG